MKDFSKLGVALLAGIAAGAVAGLLLAPNEGAKTRKKLSKKAKKIEGQLKDKAKEFKGKAKEFKGKAEDFIEKAGEIKDNVIKTAEGFL